MRSSLMRPSCVSIGAALLRRSPPRLPSVVEEASSQLLAGNMPHQPLVPGAAAAVPRDARHLGLMHGKDHRGRGAGAPERVADIDNVADARTLAAELSWNCRAQETLRARRGDRFGRHAGIVVDCGGVLSGDGCDAFGARRKTLFRSRRAAATCRFRAGPRAAEAVCFVAGRALIDALTDTSPRGRMIAFGKPVPLFRIMPMVRFRDPM
jgi:hypothetical protein